MIRRILPVVIAIALAVPAAAQLLYEGKKGPGQGKHIVFVVGDQEYRSEESMPQLARILARHHGFRCTVLLPINRETGAIDPMTSDNIPGLEALQSADLMVIFTRFQELPDDQMKHIIDYTNSGKPIIGLRTATHAFHYQTRKDSPYAKFSWRSKDPEGGWGRMVLGETWVNHYGAHQKESTRGIPAPGKEQHPILKGVENIWGPSDVYSLTTLSGDSEPLVMGQVLRGMDPGDPGNPDKQLVPVAWTKTHNGARVFTTTMGHAGDLQNEGVRRMLVNACYWALGLEDRIPAKNKVSLVGKYAPNDIGMKKHKTGLKPADLKM